MAVSAPRSPAADGRSVRGIARLGKRTKLLVKRLRSGDIAIIDHLDLDRVSADDLISCGVQAVVNCSPSTSGRYPNTGPLLLVQAGIHLVDVSGDDLFETVSEGDPLEIVGGRISRRGEVLAEGAVQDPATVQALTDQRREEIGVALEAFAHNTIEHMRQERELLAGRIELPQFNTDFRDRPALVVVRGPGHKEDLRSLRSYIRDVRPALVAVDGGADAIMEEGFEVNMIVGDMDSASERALRSGAELVVHAYLDGRAPGRERLQQLGLAHKVVRAPATSQDVAMLIAHEKAASLIVAVGSHFTLVEFLDKNRQGMSSTFLTRLRIGEDLVDAKGVSRLYQPRPGSAPLGLVVAAGLLTLMVIVLSTPGLRGFAELMWLKLRQLLGLGL